jgi:Coenzyme PQQ synthesis protein D (PqqD)
MPTEHPTAVDGLDVNEVSDGLIVYDPGTERVHYLNATAAVIFTLCDGSRGVPAITDKVAELFGADAPPAADIEACLAQLADEGVLRSGE